MLVALVCWFTHVVQLGVGIAGYPVVAIHLLHHQLVRRKGRSSEALLGRDKHYTPITRGGGCLGNEGEELQSQQHRVEVVHLRDEISQSELLQ